MITLYADVLFIINFAMLCFVFALGRMFLKRRRSLWLCVLGAVFGGGSHLGLLAFGGGNIFTYTLIMAGSCFIAYLPKGLKEFAGEFFVVLLMAFGVGGVGMWLFYYTNIGFIIGENISCGVRNITIKLLLSCCGICWAGARVIYGVFYNSVIKKRVFYNVVVRYKGRQAEFCCLGDTGNGIRDGFGGRGVVIGEFEAVKELFEEREKMKEDIFAYYGKYGGEGDFCFLPYKSIGNEKGLLFCVKADEVVIDGVKQKDFLLGVVFMTLSGDGSFRGLINIEDVFGKEMGVNGCKAA